MYQNGTLTLMGHMRKTVAAVIILAALGFTGCAGSAAPEPEDTGAADREAERVAALRLEEIDDALDVCYILPGDLVTLLDDGASVELSEVSTGGPTFDQLTCALKQLDAPESVGVKIAQTRALDGRQSDEWGNFAISWTYHPDDGANVLIERTD